MKLEISENQISWDLEGEIVSIGVENIEQAIFSKSQNVIAALILENQSSHKIVILETNGEIRHEIEQPKNHHFNYLGSNRGNDLAIMSKVNKTGWRDWWFSIDAKKGVLENLGEGR
jgi:hypothetical protein